MRTELSLALYLLLRHWRGQPPAAAVAEQAPARPAGRVIWLVAGSAGAMPEVEGLIVALGAARIGATVLVTEQGGASGSSEPGATTVGGASAPAVITVNGPDDTPTRLRAFLDHWRPDVVALVGGGMAPGLIHQVHLRDIPLYHFGADAPHIAPITPGWLARVLPGLPHASLRRLTRILARSPDAARALIRAGASAHRVEIAGTLQDGPGPLPHTEAERDALIHVLGPRPVWLAVNVPEAEEDLILAAHQAAQRHSHRLLLILVPEDMRRGPDLVARLPEALVQQVVRRGAEDYPDAQTAIYIADTEDELGLWCRLASITYFGGTLRGAAGHGPHPFTAAALGSAVVHGPRLPVRYRTAYGDLAAGQAARQVRTAGELAEAIGELLAPDKAAAQALNAWQVISDRDAATERAIRLLRDALPPDGAAAAKAGR